LTGLNWRDAAKTSKMRRIPWRRVVGRDLTAWLYMQFSAGATPAYCASLLENKLRSCYASGSFSDTFPLSEAIKRIPSNVTARYAEFNRHPK